MCYLCATGLIPSCDPFLAGKMTDLKILFIEDFENDALLLLQELQRGGYEVQWQRVETSAALESALAAQPWDLILCDYSMPALKMMDALEIVRASGLDLPFIIVSGSINEEEAISALQAGAHDFLSKNNLVRLLPAVQRELLQAENRRKRSQLDDSLRASELRFRNTIENMMEGCQILGHDWRYLYLNAAAEKHNHRPNQELLGKVYMDMWPGIESTAVFVALRRCMDERTTSHMINEFTYPDGSKGWFELQIQPVPEGIFILSSDITDYKHAEKALLEREMKLSMLFEILPVGISILDLERRVTYTNPAMKRILNISEDELLRGDYNDRRYIRADGSSIPLDEMPSVRVLREKKGIHDFEIGVVEQDGSIVWTSVSAVPVDFSDWKVVIVTSDITERKQVDNDLRNNARRLHLAATAGGVGIWDWDIVKNELIWDESMYSLYGISKTDFTGAYDAWTRTLYPDDRAVTEEEIQAAVRGEREYATEFRIVRPDGVVRVIKATSQTIRDQNGKAVRMIGTNIDITEQKQAEEEILKLNAELELKVMERTAELAAANEQLKQLSLFDQLTGLYNRHGFLLLAEAQLALAKRTRRNLLVFYADLDNLKKINDHNGHIAGDQAIVAVTHALQEAFRMSDIKARLGGDEFVVLVVDAEGGEVKSLLARLHECLAQKGQSMSVGVVTWNAQMEVAIDELISRADKAMYVEKRKKNGHRQA